MALEWIHPDELRNHPTNLSIYGDKPDPELVESVRLHGVFEDHPIGYVLDGEFRVIVSGHRRNQAARLTKQEMVPCVRLKDIEGDELAIEERIILSNKQRVKNEIVMAKEAARLIEIEKKRAEIRQHQGGVRGSSTPEVPTGRAREKVAEALGVSDKTARNLITAGTAMADAKQKGHTKKVERIEKALVEKGAAAGAREAQPKPPKNGSIVPPKYDDKKIDKPLGAIRRELDERLKAFPETERLFRAAKHALSQFCDRLTEWRQAK